MTPSWRSRLLAIVLGMVLCHGVVSALDVSPGPGKEVLRADLAVSTTHVPASSLSMVLHERGDAWRRLQEIAGADAAIFIDPRSGTPSGIMAAIPMFPGRSVSQVEPSVVGALVTEFVLRHAEAMRIDPAQMGAARATQVTPDLWHVRIPQEVAGIPVRNAHLAATLGHGNLVLLGADLWGKVRVDTRPRITADQAGDVALGHLGRKAGAVAAPSPRLEIMPVAAPQHPAHRTFEGRVGEGYAHRLVWTVALHVQGELPAWEALVDAHSSELLAFEDTNRHARKAIVGGVYPLTSTGVCSTSDSCGVMQLGYPMPYADTGLTPPAEFTSGAGTYEYSGGTVTTTLDGKHVRVVDGCGPISESGPSGSLDLGGANGDHDCTSGGVSPGNTAAARSSFYELNKLMEMARSWLPSNLWLQGTITSNVNLTSTCGAFYSPGSGSLSFFRSGNGCRNAGEIAAIFDHEWGHALDDNDSGGSLSNSTEAYADVVALYRLRASCVGQGFYASVDSGCGTTADGTGFNVNESMTGSYCTTNCSGVRDADWARHASGSPATALGFVCTHCTSGGGPCGKQTHCASAPSRQAAWDLVARDLQAPPFSMTREDAFNLGTRLFFQGSGNIGAWHACTCGGTSNGCGASNAYPLWLAADDDDGNLTNGTPHMSAIFAAFNRHGIACATPAPVNSGCAAGPVEAPSLGASPGDERVELHWSAVTGAASYQILRTEGHAGCDFGKTKLAEVVGTSFTDTNLANQRSYHYVVQALGTSPACAGPGSACVTAVPAPLAPGEVLDLRWDDRDSLSWSAALTTDTYTVYRGAGSDVQKLDDGEIDSCERFTTSSTLASDIDEVPEEGEWTWWLVRASNEIGLGPAGNATAGPRVHDPSGPCS